MPRPCFLQAGDSGASRSLSYAEFIANTSNPSALVAAISGETLIPRPAICDDDGAEMPHLVLRLVRRLMVQAVVPIRMSGKSSVGVALEENEEDGLRALCKRRQLARELLDACPVGVTV